MRPTRPSRYLGAVGPQIVREFDQTVQIHMLTPERVALYKNRDTSLIRPGPKFDRCDLERRGIRCYKAPQEDDRQDDGF